MKKMAASILVLHIVQVLIAIAGSWYAFSFFMGTILDPKATTIEHMAYLAIGAEILLLVLGFVIPLFLNSPSAKSTLLFFLICLSLLLPFLPQMVYSQIEAERARSVLTDLKKTQADFLSKMSAREKDVQERIAQKRPYTTLEILDFIAEYRNADLGYRGLPDYSNRYEELLKQACAAKIIDPNGRLPDNFADGYKDVFKKFNGQPLYSYIYFIGGPYEYADHTDIVKIKNVLQMLVDAGANPKQKDYSGKTITNYIQALSVLEHQSTNK
jgi:hypothetical protein